MATAIVPNDDFYTSNDDKHLEIFCLLWLDTNSSETHQTEEKLRSIINNLKKFQSLKECQQYIEERTQKNRLVLIVSGQMGREIVPLIHHFRHVVSIYVYCMDKQRNEEWACKYKKVKAVVVNLDDLISRIKADHKIQKKVEEPLAINIFTTNTNEGKSTTGINGQFVFSQVLIDCLLRLKSTQTDKTELINCCKKEYEDNPDELNNIHEFAQKYSSDKALWWYSKESFFYKTLNAALRTQNIHMVYLFHGFISDIHRLLEKTQSKKRVRVYRSQMISSSELKILQQSRGQFISINSFFSTSIDYDKAISFLNLSDNSDDLERVLFEIDADPKMVTTKPFADISQYSQYSDEAEVLFMIGSIFRLETVNYKNNDKVWIIPMVLCSEDEHDLKQVLMYMKQKNGSGTTNLRTLGSLLAEMGQLDLAEKYFHRFIKELPSNDPLVGDLYEDLAKLASQKGDFDTSVQLHQTALTLKNKHKPTVDLKPKETYQANRITFNYRIHNYTQWKHRGITVAGGNGRGKQLNQLSNPQNLYINHENQSIYISDYENDRIMEWKLNAKVGRVIAGGNGKGNLMNQLNGPAGIIVDTKNNSLIICDQGNRRVVEWSRQNDTKNGQILISDIDCYGITMDENGYIYVTDSVKNEVRRWKRGEMNGVIVAGGNGEGSGLNQLSVPTNLFVDQNSSVYLTEIRNQRVMKWMKNAKEGVVVAGGQGQGDKLTQLHNPVGVLVDHLGNVYVSDEQNHRIMCWLKGSKQGKVIIGGDGRGSGSKQLHCPLGLSFDREGSLYVVDSDNDRIQKYIIK